MEAQKLGEGNLWSVFVGNKGFISILLGRGGLSQSVIVSVTVGNKSQEETAVSRRNPKSWFHLKSHHEKGQGLIDH